MRSTIPASEVQVGMYVSDLDRPWEGTPFLLQGFLVSTEEEVARLRGLCKEVTIDRSRSMGEHYSERAVEENEPRERMTAVRTPQALAQAESHREGARFLALTRSFKGKIHVRSKTQPPALDANGRSRLESELRYSAPIVDDVYHALRETQLAIDTEQSMDSTRLQGLVDEMAAGVKRNPDAMAWLLKLKRTDRYSYDHAVSVSIHAMLFGNSVGLDTSRIRQLGLAGLLQDIGKIKVDHQVLAKIGPLDPEERELINRHVHFTLELLKSDTALDPEVLGIIASHHERFDGTGYPRGLRGTDIPLLGEMAGLVDTYCAMTRVRVYSPALSSQNAMEEINRLRNALFRDALVDQFLQCIGLYPVGTLVELNSGEVAVVIQQNQVRRLQPQVLVIMGEDKKLERYPRTLNLLMQPQTAVGEVYRITQALPPDAYGIDPEDFYLV